MKISEEYRGERIVLVLNWFPAASLPMDQERTLDNLILELGGRVETSLPGQIHLSFQCASQTGRSLLPERNRLVKGKKKELLRQFSSLQEH